MIRKKMYNRLQEELIRKEKEIVGLRKENEQLKEKLQREITEASDEQQRNTHYALLFDKVYDLASSITQICGRRL